MHCPKVTSLSGYMQSILTPKLLAHVSSASFVHLLLVSLDERVKDFVGVGEQAVGEEEDGGEMGAGRVG